MPYIEDNLEPGERIICKARVRRVAYVYAITLCAALMAFGRLTGLMTTELALTDKRVIGKLGLIRRKHLNLKHNAIASVRAQQGLLGQLFDYGSIVITDNADRRLVFRGIAEPVDLQMQIEEAIEVAMLGRTLSQTTKF